MKIKSIRYIRDSMFEIEFDSGTIAQFDISPYLNSEVFAALNDPHECSKIHNGKYFVEWECGADLSIDTIIALISKKGSVSA